MEKDPAYLAMKQQQAAMDAQLKSMGCQIENNAADEKDPELRALMAAAQNEMDPDLKELMDCEGKSD